VSSWRMSVYSMDEIVVMLSMLGLFKVLLGKEDWRNHNCAGVTGNMVIAAECVSANGRALLPLIMGLFGHRCMSVE
jgi:hypothetical protein